MRKYEYETGRFISIDPLWAKYYGWTPYQYSMNSPVMLVDVGGLVVEARDNLSREHIKNSVGANYSKYVHFKDDGTAYLSSPLAPLKNTNAGRLQSLINRPEVIKVSERHGDTPMLAVFGGETNEYYTHGQTVDDLTMNKLKTPGYTIYPSGSNTEYESTDKSFWIFINEENMSDEFEYKGVVTPNTKGKTTAHELFLHVWNFLTGGNYSHEGNDDERHRIKKEAQ